MRMATASLTSLLILSLLQDPLLVASGAPVAETIAAKSTKELDSQQRALHALNRLTFGPRPGDLERVQAMGVDSWIEQQLCPERLDDSALQARLAIYPAMRLNPQELASRFPSRAIIRDAADGKISVPRDPVTHAIYETQIAAYEQKRESKMEKANPTAAVHATADVDAESASTKAHEDRLYGDLAMTSILPLPPDQRMAKLISMKPEQLQGLRKRLLPQERVALFAGLSAEQKEIVVALQSPERLVEGEVLATRLMTDIYSERQLQAVMTDFWLNHFNVFARKGPNTAWYLAQYQRDVIATRAMGKFEDLLVATAMSPAMLFYLDNFSSIGPHSRAAMMAAMRAERLGGKNAEKAKDRGLNENYARELMELHTLGVDGGYSQRDVTELAKVLTGWTIDEPRQGGGYKFEERRHEPGNKEVLGVKVKEDGEKEGLEVLHLLASNPATAQFLSKKLAIRFVSDDPPQTLVDRMAKTYLKSNGDTREVLHTMFHSPEFWAADANRAKVKTPLEFVVSAVRATEGDVQHVAPLILALNRLGMPLYGCQTPNGYAWTEQAWVNSADLVNRINFAMALTANRMGTVMDFPALLNSNTADLNEKERALELSLLGTTVSPQTREAVLNHLTVSGGEAKPAPITAEASFPVPKAAVGKDYGNAGGGGKIVEPDAALPPPTDKQAATLAGMLIGSPEFQRR
jgi:uncharacterized protein (DUF1800 family)